LTLTNVQTTHAGTYHVIVLNSAGTIISADATLTVLVPVFITTQPTNLTVIAGNLAQLSIGAAGSGPITYQWRKNNVDIVGANAAQYVISNVQAIDAANYSVIVSNIAGVVTSSSATLTVIVPPSITGNPADVSVNVNTQATFTVAATGTAPLTFQWRKTPSGGAPTNIPGANSSTYTIASAQPSDEGLYSCVVSNIGGFATSTSARLTVIVAPVMGAPHLLADGTFAFLLQGVSNQSYNIDFTSTLPFWTNLTTVTLTSNSIPVTDTSTTNAGGPAQGGPAQAVRFYRARVAP